LRRRRATALTRFGEKRMVVVVKRINMQWKERQGGYISDDVCLYSMAIP
jgi:hypothetical protein